MGDLFYGFDPMVNHQHFAPGIEESQTQGQRCVPTSAVLLGEPSFFGVLNAVLEANDEHIHEEQKK